MIELTVCLLKTNGDCSECVDKALCDRFQDALAEGRIRHYPTGDQITREKDLEDARDILEEMKKARGNE